MAHNRVISTQAMARSKKIDSQTTICKLLLPKNGCACSSRFYAGPQKKFDIVLYCCLVKLQRA